jgi:hypothetical protein
MTLVELDRALRKLRLSGIADVLETRLRHAQSERLPPLDLVATLVSDELQRPKTGCSRAGTNWLVSATPIALLRASISISTRR